VPRYRHSEPANTLMDTATFVPAIGVGLVCAAMPKNSFDTGASVRMPRYI
jgi:hypothetical protein